MHYQFRTYLDRFAFLTLNMHWRKVLAPDLQIKQTRNTSRNFFCIFFWRTRVRWPLLCLCRPFCIYEKCLDSNLKNPGQKAQPSPSHHNRPPPTRLYGSERNPGTIHPSHPPHSRGQLKPQKPPTCQLWHRKSIRQGQPHKHRSSHESLRNPRDNNNGNPTLLSDRLCLRRSQWKKRAPHHSKDRVRTGGPHLKHPLSTRNRTT